MPLIFVDCEGAGPAPGPLHDVCRFELGAVEYQSKATFYMQGATKENFTKFDKWLRKFPGQVVFVSDNPAYDWQYVNYYFHLFLEHNPFGHSARRISDFYAGLRGDWTKTQEWKKLRRTKHDHNPVHDALGNAEAFERILAGER